MKTDRNSQKDNAGRDSQTKNTIRLRILEQIVTLRIQSETEKTGTDSHTENTIRLRKQEQIVTLRIQSD